MHITGKVYDMTQENFKKLTDELEALKKENVELKKLMILNLTKRDKLEDANKIMREALELAVARGCVQCSADRISHETLNQVKEMLGEK